MYPFSLHNYHKQLTPSTKNIIFISLATPYHVVCQLRTHQRQKESSKISEAMHIIH